MANGKTISVSDDLARLLDEEVAHVYAVHGLDVSRASVVAGIVKPALEARRAARVAESEPPKRGKKP